MLGQPNTEKGAMCCHDVRAAGCVLNMSDVETICPTYKSRTGISLLDLLGGPPGLGGPLLEIQLIESRSVCPLHVVPRIHPS